MSTTTTSTETTSSNPSSATPSPLLSSLQRDGYVLIPSLLKPSQLETLRTASANITSLTRAGKWPFFRTVPKQFPPWPQNQAPPPAEEGGIWGVQHLLHPEMPGRNAFAEFYFSDNVINVIRELLLHLPEVDGDASLTMELFNLLVSPTTRDFELVWHRDDIRPDLSPEVEWTQLQAKSPGGRQAHAQYNVALYDDDSLIVVPGSHRRVRSDSERNATPHQTGLQGEIRVKMKAGDAVFYDSNIFHRGVYTGIQPDGKETGRMTLHGSVGLAGHGDERARQVLQHGVGFWIGRDDASFRLDDPKIQKRAEEMRRRLIEMGRGRGSDDVGFSLEG